MSAMSKDTYTQLLVVFNWWLLQGSAGCFPQINIFTAQLIYKIKTCLIIIQVEVYWS